MILVDFSQVTISNVMVHIKPNGGNFDEDLIRHMVLNSLRSYRERFFDEFGELVICCDDRGYWRRTIFPHYKATRKKNQANSNIDWNALFTVLNKIKSEIIDNLPYKLLQVPHAEADDIIAVICETHRDEKIIIISGDKDFRQLQKYKHVCQYNPVSKAFIEERDPDGYLREHILTGDKGDGIPNFLSDDDTFVSDTKRQKQLPKRNMKDWSVMRPEDFCNSEMFRNYMRNRSLVDLSLVPIHIKEQIIEVFDKTVPAPRSKIMSYFMQNKLKKLTESINSF